jgi:signal recognition particle receptor subunit beta
MFINWTTNQINIKVVYHGPGLSGKTTSLEHIYTLTPKEYKGDFVALNTDEDRTLYFDYFQMEFGNIKGFKPCFQLYTVPGQRRYFASRKLILHGADGVIFVADSDGSRLQANVDMLSLLERHLREYGLDPQTFPIVFQYNKRDLPTALSVDELQHYLNPYGCPYFETIAVSGSGVITTFKAAVNLVVAKVIKDL